MALRTARSLPAPLAELTARVRVALGFETPVSKRPVASRRLKASRLIWAAP